MERTQHPPGKKPEAPPKEERKLDKALEETFPGSDPVSISVPDKEKEWTPEELAEAESKRREAEKSKRS
jgi:hypothetical protein